MSRSSHSVRQMKINSTDQFFHSFYIGSSSDNADKYTVQFTSVDKQWPVAVHIRIGTTFVIIYDIIHAKYHLYPAVLENRQSISISLCLAMVSH